MGNQKFELFMGCLGNGITVCNKAVTESGDYKHIAHISNAGNIKFYVSDGYIPEEAMRKIQKCAAESAEKFKREFEKLSAINQYGKILDSVSCQELIDITNDKRPLAEKLPELREKYYKKA